jgi:hypothetical protein
MTLILALATVLTGVACQKKEKKKEIFTYEFKVNSCSTDRHTYSSVAALCEGLADEARNNRCAYYPRLEMANKYGCPQVDPQTRVFKTPLTQQNTDR